VTDVVNLFRSAPEPSFLCNFSLYRRLDGAIAARLIEMDGGLIETTGHDIASRMKIIAEWVKQGAADIQSQAQTFEDASDD